MSTGETPRPTAETLEDFAIVVGINHYREFPTMRGAHNDAEFFAEWLKSASGGGLKPANVKTLLSSDDDYRPTVDGICDELETYFKQHKKNNDNGTKQRIGNRFYFYLAGHGVDAERNDPALLMANATPLQTSRCLPGKLVAEGFRISEMFREIVLIMDCCRTIESFVTPAFPLRDHMRALAETGGGRDVKWLYAFAAQPTAKVRERSLKVPGKDERTVQGLFTNKLLWALNRGVDGTGVVTSQSLKQYLKRELTDIQNPEVFFDDSITLIKKSTGSDVTVRVRVGDGPDFWVRHGQENALVGDPLKLDTKQVSGEEFELTLSPGLYLFGQGDNWVIRRIIGDYVAVDLKPAA